MFDGVLAPTDSGYAPYTRNLDTFTNYVQRPLQSYWDALSPMQRQQLQRRGYGSFQNMWNDVTGNGDPTNQAFAVTGRARYLTRSNPKLDDKTAYDVSEFVVYSGLPPYSGSFDYAGMEHPELARNGGRTVYITYFHPTGPIGQRVLPWTSPGPLPGHHDATFENFAAPDSPRFGAVQRLGQACAPDRAV